MNATNHPCESPHEHSEPVTESQQIELADFRFWRVYLYVHLGILLSAAICHWTEVHADWSLVEDNQLAKGLLTVLIFAAHTGIMYLCALPPVLIVLIYCACYGSSRYLFVAFAEILISGAYVLAVLPMVQ